MNIKKDDIVVVLSGKDKGKEGKVLSADPKNGKVIVEGVNVASRHMKPRKQGEEGGIIKKETPSTSARSCASAQSAPSPPVPPTKYLTTAQRHASAKNAAHQYKGGVTL